MPILEQWQDGREDGGGRFGCACGWAAEARGGEPAFGGEGAEDHYAPHLELEPEHLEIDLHVDLDQERADGKVIHMVKANREGVRRLVLDGESLSGVRAVGLGGEPVDFSYDGHRIELLWQRPFAKGERRRVEIAYGVERPVTGLFFMRPSEGYPGKPLYAATDHETERARYWLPCVDHPSVRTTLDFRLRAAEPLTILANGHLVGETRNGDGTKTAHWRLEQRCPSYLVCFAIGDFTRRDHGVQDGMPVASFATRDFTPEDLERTFGKTPAMLAWMQRKLATPFPYPKYFQFALPAFSGAMENISLVSWSDRFVCTEEIAGELSWLTDQVNVHEMAHSYFGDLVGCRDFAHVWLKESWATYMESCWLEDQKGEDELRYDLWRNAGSYFSEADERYARPLVTRRFKSSWQMFDAHLYPGGACRLHTLRCELGDEVFWPAVADYLATYREGVAETDDFRRVMERHSGRSLQRFFDQWFLSPGYPDLKVTFSYDKEARVGTFEVVQKQAEESKGGRVFELATDLGWVVDGVVQSQPIRLTKARQSFNVPMEKDPDQVRFDPAGKVLHKLELDPGETRLLKQLTEAKDIVGRIAAALTLGAKGKRSGIRAVAEAYRREPFWGVRREMLRALEESGTEDGLQGILAAVAAEKDHLVLDRVMIAAGSYRDDRVREAVTARLAAGDLPPQAKAKALIALGLQREEAPVELLQEAAEADETRHALPAAAAFHALGLARRPEVAPYLLQRAAYGRVPFRARRGVVQGLASLGPYVEKRWAKPIEERLVDLLRDPEPWIAQAAAHGLRTVEARGAVAAIEAYRAGLPAQEQVGIDGILKALSRSDEGGRTAALEKQLDKLKEQCRKLQDRIQDLEDRQK